MKKTLILILLALLAAPLWGQKASDYRAAAERGDKVAQYKLGICYEKGEGVAQDYTQAVYWYKKATEQGYYIAAYCNLGLCYSEGRGVEQSYAHAYRCFSIAANHGYAPAQLHLGFAFLGGSGVKENTKSAMYWFQKAANQGNAIAQCMIAGIYHEGEGVEGVDKDNEQALFWLTKSANQDCLLAQYYLGHIYHVGDGVAKDCNLARYWLEKASNINIEKIEKLAAWYGSPSIRPEIVEKELLEAEKELKEVEDCIRTKNNLLDAYDEEPNSMTESLQTSAAELFAQADNYRYGRNGVDKNAQKAVELYTQAANMGNAEAQLSLGYCYYMGEGVGEDCQKAHEWLKKAETKKHTLSAKRQQLLETTLSHAASCVQKQ